MPELATAIFLLALGDHVSEGAAHHPSSSQYSPMQERMQIAFVRSGFVFSAERRGLIEDRTKTASIKLNLFKTAYLEGAQLQKTECYEINERRILLNTAAFLRWRMTSSDYLYGTEFSLDDHYTGVFRIPLRIIKPKRTAHLDATGKRKDEEWVARYEKQGSNFIGGDSVIGQIVGKYRRQKEGLGGSAGSGGLVPYEGWFRGMDGVYFDFVPKADENWISLFVLFNKNRLIFSSDPGRAFSTNAMEVWECDKGISDRVFKDGTYDGSRSLARGDMIDLDDKGKPLYLAELSDQHNKAKHLMKGWIATDMSEPFYVVQRKDDYYFSTISGKIYIAPQASGDPKKVEGLIADLDSEVFTTREKATRDLQAIGKAAQPALEGRLSQQTISAEQKKRITRILTELKHLPDRETKLLWQDEKRPVEKLLFDQDKDKVYVFTKPDQEKRVWFFEVDAKPEARLYTGKADPDTPTGVPASVRTFVEYARFVRAAK
jgi:hypothetical protein